MNYLAKFLKIDVKVLMMFSTMELFIFVVLGIFGVLITDYLIFFVFLLAVPLFTAINVAIKGNEINYYCLKTYGKKAYPQNRHLFMNDSEFLRIEGNFISEWLLFLPRNFLGVILILVSSSMNKFIFNYLYK